MESTTSILSNTVSMRRASEITGVPYNTVRHAVAQGSVPAWKVGRTIRVRVTDVVALVQPVVTSGGGAA